MKNPSEQTSLIPFDRPRLVSNINFFKKSTAIGCAVTVSLAIMNIALLATKEANFADGKHKAVDNIVAGSLFINLAGSIFSVVNFAKMKLTERTLANFDNVDPEISSTRPSL